MTILRIIVTAPREPNLDWLINESGAAAGVRSSFEPQREAAMGGRGSGPSDPHIARTRGYYDRKQRRTVHPWLENVGRERALHARFGSLTETEQGILHAAYFREGTGDVVEASLDRALGDLVRVATLTAAFREVYEDERGTPIEWLADVCRRGGKAPGWGATDRGPFLDEVRKQANALVDGALESWRSTSGRPVKAPRSPEEAATAAEATMKRAAAYAAAAKPVAGPKAKGEPRTWAPMDGDAIRARAKEAQRAARRDDVEEDDHAHR